VTSPQLQRKNASEQQNVGAATGVRSPSPIKPASLQLDAFGNVVEQGGLAALQRKYGEMLPTDQIEEALRLENGHAGKAKNRLDKLIKLTASLHEQQSAAQARALADQLDVSDEFMMGDSMSAFDSFGRDPRDTISR